MLERLDTIDWAGYRAERIPSYLRDLTSTDNLVRWNAQTSLAWDWTWETAPFVISFLLELVASPNVLDKDVLLKNFIGPTSEFPDEDATALFPEGVPNPLIKAVHDAFKAGYPIYRQAREDPNFDVRIAAEEVLSACQRLNDAEENALDSDDNA